MEKPSIDRLVKLLDINRTHAWRARQLQHIPNGLFDRLLKGGVYGLKQLAQVGIALQRDGNQPAEIERCPHCGEVVRVRWLVGTKARKIISQWIDDGMPGNAFERNDDDKKPDDHQIDHVVSRMLATTAVLRSVIKL